VRARGGDGEGWRSRGVGEPDSKQSLVRRGEERSDRRDPRAREGAGHRRARRWAGGEAHGPSARGGEKKKEEKEGRVRGSWAGPGSGLRAPGKRGREVAAGRAAGGEGEKGEKGEGKRACWAGPKGEKREGGKKKEGEKMLLNLNIKIEFKFKSN
jgi:hypothetical protein